MNFLHAKEEPNPPSLLLLHRRMSAAGLLVSGRRFTDSSVSLLMHILASSRIKFFSSRKMLKIFTFVVQFAYWFVPDLIKEEWNKIVSIFFSFGATFVRKSNFWPFSKPLLSNFFRNCGQPFGKVWTTCGKLFFLALWKLILVGYCVFD